MNLAWLATSSLALLALGVLPVLAHFARRRPEERQPFGAMMLLERLVRRMERRRRLQDLALLLVRMLAVILVVLAAAGPELHLPGTLPRIGSLGRVVLVVDNSLSMALDDGGLPLPDLPEVGAGTLLARARQDARRTLEDLPEGTRVGLVLATAGDGTAGPVTARALTPALTTDHAEVERLLEKVGPTWQGTDLTGALRAARTLLGGEPGEVVIFSDEAGPFTVEAARPEVERLLAAGAVLHPRPVRSGSPTNLAVMGAEYGQGQEGGSVRARIVSFGPDPSEPAVTATLPDGSEMTAFTPVPGCPAVDGAPGPCEAADELFTVPREVPGGVASVAVKDPALDLDNARYFHLPRVGASRVLVVDGDPGPTPTQSEVYFLERALAPWGAMHTGVTPEITALAGVADLDPARYRVVFLANVADPCPVVDRLSSFVRAGGALVLTAGENVTPEVYNACLSTLLPTPLRKVRNLVALDAAGGVSVIPPDPALELFRPFSREGRGSFARVHFRRLVTVEPFPPSEDVHTLLELEGGLPLLVERRLGPGRVLLLTGTVDLSWGNLPLQAAFLPFVQRIVGYLGGESASGAARFAGTVGSPVSIPLPDATLSPEVTGPQDRPVPSRVVAGHVQFVPWQPGPYTLTLAGAPPLAWVAVNPPPEESDVRTWGDLAAVEREIEPGLFTRRIPLGPWALAGALLLLLAQAAAGIRRRHVPA